MAGNFKGPNFGDSHVLLNLKILSSNFGESQEMKNGITMHLPSLAFLCMDTCDRETLT